MIARDAEKILDRHKLFFKTGKTHNIEYRKASLKCLWENIKNHEKEVLNALFLDLGKPQQEAYETEIGLVYRELREALKHLDGWAAPEKVKTPYYLFPAKSYLYKEPYGVVYIIGPFNYPFLLMLSPLIGAIAAGNCAVLKPSEYAPNTERVIGKIIKEAFEEGHVSVVSGAAATGNVLSCLPFDFIFFTGGGQTGKKILSNAAQNLTPVVLELGGKSPAIVDGTANLKTAAEKIIWGKMVNAGQTCVAPDYCIVEKPYKNAFILELQKAITKFYGSDPVKTSSLGRIINDKHFERLNSILEQDKKFIIWGGQRDREQKYMSPTIITGPEKKLASMKEEIFGPILPVLSVDSLNKAISYVNDHPKPLAAYFSTRSRKRAETMINQISFGGGCVNGTILHLANTHLPFGGVGPSGMGKYHGYAGFQTFSHEKSILIKNNQKEMPLLTPPYHKIGLWILRKILK